MWVRAGTERNYTEAVIHDLVTRGAGIEEVDWMAPLPVVRARAALRQLLVIHGCLLRSRTTPQSCTCGSATTRHPHRAPERRHEKRTTRSCKQTGEQAH